MPRAREEILADIQAALARPEEDWYRQVLDNDPCICPLSQDETALIVHGAMSAASAAAQAVTRRHATASALELAAALNLEVMPMEESSPQPLFGLYQPAARRILLGNAVIASVEAFIATHALDALTPAGDLRNCVLFHEIFHALEEEQPGIFTRSAMLQRRLFGLIPLRRGLSAASEIGAIHFSRIMAGIAYSPCIFEHYQRLADEKTADGQIIL